MQGWSSEDSLSCFSCDDFGASGEENSGQTSAVLCENQVWPGFRTLRTIESLCNTSALRM